MAAKFYQTVLLEHPTGQVALGYLTKRGLKLATIKEWALGFAPDQWEVVTGALRAKGYTDDEIVATGLGVPSERGKSSYDRFRGRIMFPIRDLTGRVVGFSGRILGEGEPKYLNSPDSLIYQKSSVLYGMDLAKNEIKKANLAVLVEGNVDVISSHQAGVKNVVAPLGTALTGGQIAILMRFTESAALAFDADLAGDGATRRGIEMAESTGLNIRVVHLEGHDPDDMIVKSPKAWVEAVSRATPIYDFYLESAFNKADATSPEGKRKISREILPHLKNMTDPILRGHYLKIVATRLSLEEKDLEEALLKLAESPSSVPAVAPVEVERKSRQLQLEEEVIKLILELRCRPTLLIPEDFTGEALTKIYKELIKVFPEGDKEGQELTGKAKFDTTSFVTRLPSEAVAIFDEILLKLREEEVIDETQEERLLLQTARELRRTSLHRFLRKLGLMIKQAEASGKNAEVGKLNHKFRELSQKLANLEVPSA